MSLFDIAALNATYAVAGRISFQAGPGTLTTVELRGPQGHATVALDGAQVLAYTPSGQPPVLFTSRQAIYTSGKSVRGGIPVCWPWFGGSREDAERPFHGFARMLPWQVRGTSASDTSISLELGLNENDFTRRYWPHTFDLRLVVTLADALYVDLVARNTDAVPVEITGALHSYFAIGDIKEIVVAGLEETTYLDKVDDGREKRQEGLVRITGHTDRIYVNTTSTCVIDDPANSRQIVVEKRGSHSTVVWNPWIENAAAMADMADDEYTAMICVETTNAGSDIVTLAPGESHTLGTTLRSEMNTY